MKRSEFQEIAGELEAISTFMEGLKAIDELTQKQSVDLGARIRIIKGHVEKVDETLSKLIKETLKEDNGDLHGDRFTATGKIVPTSRLDTKRLQEEKPKIYADFLKDGEQYRITYAPR